VLKRWAMLPKRSVLRWVNSSGEYIYSNDTLYDPTRDPDERRKDWKLTKPLR
jgi:hypothetical protein